MFLYIWNITSWSEVSLFSLLSQPAIFIVGQLIPLIFLCAFSPFLFGSENTRRQPLAYIGTFKWKTRLIHLRFLLVASAAIVLLKWTALEYVYVGYIGINALTNALLWLSMKCCRQEGIMSSGVIHITWTLLLLSKCCLLLRLTLYPTHNELRNFICYLMFNILCWLDAAIVMILAILCCIPDRRMTHCYLMSDAIAAADRITGPEETVSFLSKSTFYYANKLLRYGASKTLTYDDFWPLSSKNTVIFQMNDWKNRYRFSYLEFMKRLARWREDAYDLSRSVRASHIALLLIRCTRWKTVTGSSLSAFILLLRVADPLYIRLLISCIEDGGPLWCAVCISILFFILSTIKDLIYAQQKMLLMSGYMNVKTIVMESIYEKVLLLSNDARAHKSSSDLISIISIDLKRIQFIWTDAVLLLYHPALILTALYIIYGTIGGSSLVGFAIMTVLSPLNFTVAACTQKYRARQMRLKDERVKLIHEVLHGIKVLKLYAWEPVMEIKVAKGRDREMRQLQNQYYLNAIYDTVLYATPFMAAFGTFTYYTLIEGKKLEPSIVFVTLSLFEMMKSSFAHIPRLLVDAMRAIVSLQRIAQLLYSEELHEYREGGRQKSKDEIAVCFSDATLTWDSALSRDQNVHLHRLNMTIKQGELVAVVGKVSSGKSSLLSAILGEMTLISGNVTVNGRISYSAQEPWIQNMSIRENILHGSSYDEEFYKSVLNACALRKDIHVLPGGDMTQIGEKGITLSTGQKLRINIARAAYQSADIFLLDDPFSSVDRRIANRIFVNLFGGVLHNKTTIFTTDALHLLKNVDRIIVVEEGGIHEQGTYEQLLRNRGLFSELVREFVIKEMQGRAERERRYSYSDYSIDEEVEDLRDVIDDLAVSQGGVDLEMLSAEAQNAKLDDTMEKRSCSESELGGSDTASLMEHGRLVEEENVEVVKVLYKNYITYFKSFGMVRLLFYMLSLFVFACGCDIASNMWLVDWIDDHANLMWNLTTNYPLKYRIQVYALLGFCKAIFMGIALLTVANGIFAASNLIHYYLTNTLLRSPINFFDATSHVQLLTRFNNDMEKIDEDIPRAIFNALLISSTVFTSLIIISSSIPYLVIAIIPTFLCFTLLCRYYKKTSLQIRRLESKSFSSICSHLQETLTGVPLIRAFRSQRRFIETSRNAIDQNSAIFYAEIVANRWIQVRMDFVMNLFMLIVSILAICQAHYAVISVSILGLIITYATTLGGYVVDACRQLKDTEMDMVAVERINEYSKQQTEACWTTAHPHILPKDWPKSGCIVFWNFYLRYHPESPLALRNINLCIYPREKIAVVGRSGSGKSTLAMALFRLVEGCSGSIIIDGCEISSLGLHDLRKRLTIIPQDPMLFSGSLRSNLDPFGRFTDEQLYEAMDKSNLLKYVTSLEYGLDHDVGEQGHNLSAGQRKLVCLTRALLKRTSKILIVDEAISATDVETESLIHKLIKKHFAESTVIRISRHLYSIADYDRVMVMQTGHIIEFDKPSRLLADHNSHLYAMLKEVSQVGRIKI